MSDTDDMRHTDKEILEKLAEIEVLLATHIAEHKVIQPQLAELVIILERSKGVITLFRLLLYIGAPLTALIYWIKEHIKL